MTVGGSSREPACTGTVIPEPAILPVAAIFARLGDNPVADTIPDNAKPRFRDDATKTVRRARLEDVPRLVKLGLEFYATEGGRSPDARQLVAFAASHIDSPGKVCLVAAHPISAVICGIVAPHYLTGEPAAFKTAWYALPCARGHGAHLLRAFEAWAAESGARRLFVAGRHDRTLRLLLRRKYRHLETVYEKDLTWQNPHSPS